MCYALFAAEFAQYQSVSTNVLLCSHLGTSTGPKAVNDTKQQLRTTLSPGGPKFSLKLLSHPHASNGHLVLMTGAVTKQRKSYPVALLGPGPS